MQFTEKQIELARQMRDAGLQWEPAVGHYVFDETALIEVPSPFQERVYFILDMHHFLRRAGSIQGLKSRMFWLPQWHQARRIAWDQGISENAIAAVASNPQVLRREGELQAIYWLILSALRANQ